MKRIVEVEETVHVRHQIYIECDSLEQLDKALDRACRCFNLDDFVDALDQIVHVNEVNEDYFEETEDIDYFDDYEDDSE